MASSDLDPDQQRSRRASIAATVLGAALVGISFLPAVAGERERWTNERAREYQDASMRIQKLTHQLGEQKPDTAARHTEVEFQKAMGRFQDLQTELNQARNDGGLLKMTLRAIGGVLGVAGIAYFFASRRKESQAA